MILARLRENRSWNSRPCKIIIQKMNTFCSNGEPYEMFHTLNLCKIAQVSYFEYYISCIFPKIVTYSNITESTKAAYCFKCYRLVLEIVAKCICFLLHTTNTNQVPKDSTPLTQTTYLKIARHKHKPRI